MHIVIDARNRTSSTGRYTDRLLEHLQNIDNVNKYTILLNLTDPWKPRESNFATLPCGFPQFSVNPFDEFRFSGLLYSLKPDLVHFTMTQQPLLYFGRIVTTTHDLTMLRYTRAGRHNILFHLLRMRLYRVMFWWSHRKSRAIITPSKFVADDLAKLQPFTAKKTTVTHEASEPPISGKAEPVDGVGKEFIFHSGSPFPHKNIERLIEAFELLAPTHPNLQLVLVGKKEYYFEKLAKKVAKSEFAERILLPGFVSDQQLKWLHQNAKAYVLASLSEGFGLPGLEVMAHGCPLVSSNATCLPEIYGNAALFFNPTDIDDMAMKIERILNDTAFAAELTKRGKDQLSKYSWQRMAEQTHAIYAKVGRQST